MLKNVLAILLLTVVAGYGATGDGVEQVSADRLTPSASGSDLTLTGTLSSEQVTSTDDATIGDDLSVIGDATVRGILTVTNSTVTAGNVIYTNTFWEDLRFPAVIAPKGPGITVVGDDLNTNAVFFTNAASTNNTDEMVYGEAQMPHAWKLGSEIHPHVHFLQHDASQTNNWYMQYRIQCLGQANATAWVNTAPASNEIVYASGALHQIAEFAPINMSAVTNVSCIVDWRITRNGDGDVYNGDMYLKEFDIHYEIDQPGSQSEYIK
jgi:hypothetical protein